MSDEHFVYNYALLLQESNVSMPEGQRRTTGDFLHPLSGCFDATVQVLRAISTAEHSAFRFLQVILLRPRCNTRFCPLVRALADEYYPWVAYQSPIECLELISVHLRVVPPNVVREQCEQLWQKLMDAEE